MEKIGKYEIIDKIGEGGFGVVYKGRDPFIKRLVAVKTCSSENEDIRKRFFREAEIAGNLHHNNVVTIHDFGVEGDTPFLVQEFLTGEDLDQKIKKKRTELSLSLRVKYLCEIAKGLEYAHSQGVIHRDIKPANIRVLDDGAVKVMDFGIAKLKDQESQLTQTGMTLGTVAYLSPEQLKGEDIDHRVDIFSYGVLAYELLTFKRPFQGQTISTLFYQLLNENPPPITEELPNCPIALSEIVARCLAKNADDRYPDFATVIADLEAALAQLETEGGTDGEGATVIFKPGEMPAPGMPPIESPPSQAVPRQLTRLAERARQALEAGDLTAAELTINMARRDHSGEMSFGQTFNALIQEVEALKKKREQEIHQAEELANLLEQVKEAKHQGKLTQAIATLEQARRLGPDRPEVVALGQELEAARKAAKEAADKQARLDLLIASIETALSKNDAAGAKASLEKLYQVDPKHPKAKGLRTEVGKALDREAKERERSGQLAIVVNDVQRLLDQGKLEAADKALADARSKLGQDEPAFQPLAKDLDERRTDALLQQRLAEAERLFNAGDLERAQAAAQEILTARADHSGGKKLLADCERELRKKGETEREQKLEAARRSIEGLLAKEELDKAKEELTKAVADLGQQPELARLEEELRVSGERRQKLSALLEEAEAAVADRKLEQARDALRQAVQLDPKNAELSQRLRLVEDAFEKQKEESKPVIPQPPRPPAGTVEDETTVFPTSQARGPQKPGPPQPPGPPSPQREARTPPTPKPPEKPAAPPPKPAEKPSVAKAPVAKPPSKPTEAKPAAKPAAAKPPARPTPPPKRAEPAPTPAKKTPWALIGGGVAALIVGAVVVVSLVGGGEGEGGEQAQNTTSTVAVAPTTTVTGGTDLDTPPATTTLPEIEPATTSVEVAPATTTLPAATTSLPQVTTSVPAATTSVPAATTSVRVTTSVAATTSVRATTTSVRPTTTTAGVDPTAAEIARIQTVLNQYSAAWSALDANAINAVHPGAGVSARDMRNFKSHAVSISGCKIEVNGNRATANCNVERVVTPKAGAAQTATGHGFSLVKQGGRWVIDNLL